MTKNMMNRELAIVGAIALVCSGGVAITLALFRFLLLELGMATNHLYCGVESWSLLLRFMASILPFHVRARENACLTSV